MKDLRRKKFATSSWVTCETTSSGGEKHNAGYREEFFGLNSVAFPPVRRELAEKLDWSSIGLWHSGGPYAFKDGTYRTFVVYQHHDGVDDGFKLVVVQSFNSTDPSVWHINPDLIMALRLHQEGDRWVAPDEGYCEVMRQRRNKDGEVCAVEIRSEFLRDYLAARSLALRLSYYRQRVVVLSDTTNIPWAENGLQEGDRHDRFQASVIKVGPNGLPTGSWSVMRISRTDEVDDDVPLLSEENDDNVEVESWTREALPHVLARAQGEMWRDEWVEPAEISERVRGDDHPEEIRYVVDASGQQATSKELDDEDVGKWLWFNSSVIEALRNKRGGGLDWYTRHTGGVWCSPDFSVHFGINKLGLINTYASDVARLPRWQQKIWAAHNVTPDGGVSEELMSAQVRAVVANTTAAEPILRIALEELDSAFEAKFGEKLFNHHESAERILQDVHRFRAVRSGGLLSLAKDLARLIADRMSQSALRRALPRPKDAKWGTLKWLEHVLATSIESDAAHKLMGPLFHAYDLRLGDAHLPSSEIENTLKTLGINPEQLQVEQGERLIAAVVTALVQAGMVIDEMTQLVTE
jgi:hypothetical protein